MKKKTVILNSLLTLSVILGASGAAFADYDGPPVDVNLVNEKPAKYAECDKYLNDANAKRFAACEFGRDEAERMADRFAGGHGKLAGYLRGYAWGMHKMIDAYQNDATEEASGAAAVNSLGQYMQAGIQAGQQAGTTSGQSQGNSDAIGRFEAVVNTGRNPDPAVRVPQTNYQGEDGAYEKYVGPVPNPHQIAQNELNLGELPVYSDFDTVVLGDEKPLNVWDILFDDGVYVFQKDQWYDPDRAIQTWMQMPNDQRPKYDNLNQGAPVDPATAQPVDLQAVFRSAFHDSYSYYVSYYYSSQFYQNLSMGDVAGEAIGEQIGKRVAHYKGLEQAFNVAFKKSSASSYRDAFVAAYTGQFNATFQDYLSNPKLSISFDSIIGAVNDGIIQPGEQIAAKITVKNIGGVGTPLQVSLGGDVTDAQAQTLSIGKLEARTYTTGYIATIDSRLRPRDTAQVSVNVNGISADLNQVVYKMMQITNSRQRLDVNQGDGEIIATVTNMATVRTPGQVDVTLQLDGRNITTQHVGFVAAGDSVDVSLPFANEDSYEFINGTVKATVVVTMNGDETDAGEQDLNAGTDRDTALASYFDALANGKGFVPAHVDPSTRLAQVAKDIATDNDQNVIDVSKHWHNTFKHEPDTTVAGKVATQFKATVQSEQARTAYDQLARSMWDARKHLKKFLWIRGPKRKAYDNLVLEFAKEKLKD